MILWIGFAVLTAGVIAFMGRPLFRPADTHSDSQSADLAVYRDQLLAIEAEREQGLLDDTEAEAARAELGRRLLRAADQGSQDEPASANCDGGGSEGRRAAEAHRRRSAAILGAGSGARMLVYVAGLLIPLLSIGIYLVVGSPGLPGTPFANRLAESGPARSIDELVGLVEKRLQAHPEDGQGWEVIAPVYMKQQRYNDAARAFANAIRLNGETPSRVAGFAEALVLANNGLIVPDARRAYERLLKVDPERTEARFWLALAKEQDGDLAGGIADLEEILKSAPADAPWRSLVEGKLSEMRTALAGGSTGGGGSSSAAPKITGMGGGDSAPVQTQNAPGPSAADVAVVKQMSTEERHAFISQMVDGLAARLAQNGKDLEGWKRLARAYKVMGRNEDAVKALADARRALAGDAAAIEAIEALAKDLGIGS